MKAQTPSAPFLWRPGEGCDGAALARMRRAFPKPKYPMGEAWFMGETRAMFWDLLGDLGALSLYDIQRPLYEIASGAKAFGEMNEWTEWFHFILAETLPRAHETWAFDSHIESLVTTFMALYPNGVVDEPYKGFRDDAQNTLGRAMMNASCWNGENIILGEILHREFNPRVGVWFWYDASSDFSAAMFFCLKYLHEEQVAPWLRSVFAISCPHWRAQIMVWFVGAHDLLMGRVCDPSTYSVTDRPSLHWEAVHLLKYAAPNEFVPRVNREVALATVTSIMSDGIYLDWLLSMAAFDYLESELAELPETFRELYIVAP